ncbi:MAG: alpha/beta hydrolase fold [Akkermansiaceae bacterium]|nr:alpha/beta hydrolase fold [Akkermansiaceae bacterium]
MKLRLVVFLLPLLGLHFQGAALHAEAATPQSQEAVQPRVAFLGDSIMFDGRWPLRVEASLRATPQYANAEIVNFGLPSETLSGLSEPGHAEGKFPRPCLFTRLTGILQGFHPSLIIACYGMNDGIYLAADPARLRAYQDGVAHLNDEARKAGARIIWVTPSLFKADHPDQDTVRYDAVLDTFAKLLLSKRDREHWEVIDLRTPLRKDIATEKRSNRAFVYSGDGIHPDEQGHRFIAGAVARGLWPLLKLPGEPATLEGMALSKLSERANLLKLAWLTKTGYDRPGIPAGLPLPEAQEKAAALLTDYVALSTVVHSDWQGFDRIDFTSAGRPALLVSPKDPAPGNPWIWRTEFFGHEPQADIALLQKGFHFAYVVVQNLWGAPAALDHMDRFYGILTRTYHLAPRSVLEGFSRGGLFALNWAARNPGETAALYLDAPLCDFKSAPYGIKDGMKSADDWHVLLSAWNMTEEQALAYDKNPVDNLAPLAGQRVQILSVIGDADEVVPVAENTGLVETRYKALGGEIQVIHKPGGKHHPHSLPDPAPIVAFVLKATGAPQ